MTTLLRITIGTTALAICLAPHTATADTLSDFGRAASSRECRLSPYSGIRSDCSRAYNRAKDRADKIDCARLVVMPLIAQLRAAEASLKAEKAKKNGGDRRAVRNLKDKIRKLKRKIKERRAKAKTRQRRASRVIRNFSKAHRVMGSRLENKIRNDVRRALDKAKREKDKGRHAKLMARFAKISGFAARIKNKVRGFRALINGKRAAAKAHHITCKKVAQGRL